MDYMLQWEGAEVERVEVGAESDLQLFKACTTLNKPPKSLLPPALSIWTWRHLMILLCSHAQSDGCMGKEHCVECGVEYGAWQMFVVSILQQGQHGPRNATATLMPNVLSDLLPGVLPYPLNGHCQAYSQTWM